ncbi:MAG: phosphoenolpyruvate carboxykinase (GTP) [Deltaproteobacteria bacterium]|nr:phosphoenolpyruvate carboxykinase (GTP) [Deltaproteobacteria bacterium]
MRRLAAWSCPGARLPYLHPHHPRVTPRTVARGDAPGGRTVEISNQHLLAWVEEVRRLCKPEQVVMCDGSEAERERLVKECVSAGELIALNQDKLPGCYLHRSAPHDVARTEQLTFVCTPTRAETGTLANWMSPEDARTKLTALYDGAMRGRVMYVIPFLMGPPGSTFSKVGVEITDSRYVVLNMRIMTRVGAPALQHLGDSGDFTRCLHSLGDLSPERRFICHFPQDNTVWSVGSGYGGNALLGKKCMALRIASYLGRKEGWLAEHMLVVGVQRPDGKVRYLTGAFPSACGKTNLAMLVPPQNFAGWKVWTVGDDIAWLRPGPDGRLWAVNPEAGFFGVVPGTSSKTNPNAMEMIRRNTIYTNVALRPDGTVWWEGHDDPPPERCLDWQGREWTPASKEKAAHPNSRFTVSATQCRSISPEFDNPRGVPIDAILFGARRRDTIPLVFEARNWQHGTFLGATLTSETTAAATGAVGVLRRDPMAMLPFLGYDVGDYWQNWLDVGSRLTRPPRVFRVNWFRTGPDGNFLWPGFGDNMRVLKWVIDRCDDRAAGSETCIGTVPARNALDRQGLDLKDAALDALLRVDPVEWSQAVSAQAEFLVNAGDRVPPAIRAEHARLAARVREALP